VTDPHSAQDRDEVAEWQAFKLANPGVEFWSDEGGLKWYARGTLASGKPVDIGTRGRLGALLDVLYLIEKPVQ
jgi:hypothetical protein